MRERQVTRKEEEEALLEAAAAEKEVHSTVTEKAVRTTEALRHHPLSQHQKEAVEKVLRRRLEDWRTRQDSEEKVKLRREELLARSSMLLGVRAARPAEGRSRRRWRGTCRAGRQET